MFVLAFLLLLLGHGCENLLHLIDDVVQLVRVSLDHFLDGVTHCRLHTQAQKCSEPIIFHAHIHN